MRSRKQAALYIRLSPKPSRDIDLQADSLSRNVRQQFACAYRSRRLAYPCACLHLSEKRLKPTDGTIIFL